MTVGPGEQSFINRPSAILVKHQPQQLLAYWVSQLLNPPLLGLVAALVAGATAGSIAGWMWTAVYMLFAAILPTSYVIIQYKRGHISDIHLNIREERYIPTLLMVIGAMIAWLLLLWGNAPRMLMILAGAQLLQSVVFFLITLEWKISAHTTSAATLFTICLLLFGPFAAAASPLLFLVMWARVTLKRHTLAQTLAGIILGCMSITVVFLLNGG